MAGRPRQFDEEHALMAAMDVFWAKGFEAAGVRELLDAMGMCRQSFYDTFGDKRQLFLQAIERYAQQGEDAMCERLSGPEPAIEAVRSLLQDRAKNASGGDCRGCFAVNTIVEWGDADDEVGAVVSRMIRRLAKLFTDTLDRAKAEGGIAQDADTRSLADVVLFTFLGFSAVGRIRMPKSMANNVLAAVLPPAS